MPPICEHHLTLVLPFLPSLRVVFFQHIGGYVGRDIILCVLYVFLFLNFVVYIECTKTVIFSQTKLMGNVLHV